jgi:hypothetical protein
VVNGKDEVIDRIVAELSHFSRAASLAMTLHVGELVFFKVFGGDIGRVRSRGRKDSSFARLARHPKLPFSGTTLWRSVAIYELTLRLPSLAKSKHLGVAHLRAVLDLPGELQEKLLRTAEKEKWPRELVERRARALRVVKAVKSGRPPTPPAIRCVRLFDKLVQTGALIGTEAIETMDALEAARAKEIVSEVRKWCDAVEVSLSVANADR